MAELCVISSVTVFFRDVPMKFRIEAVIKGELEPNTNHVAGIDAIAFRHALDAVSRDIEYRSIGKSLSQAGLEFHGMESIAIFILKSMKNNFPVSYVKIWEGSDEYAVVYVDDISES